MNKLEVVRAIADKTGLSRKEVESALEVAMETIKDCVANKKEPVTFRGFGTFGIKHRAAKAARDINKNVTIQVPAHDIPSFKPSKEFVDRM